MLTARVFDRALYGSLGPPALEGSEVAPWTPPCPHGPPRRGGLALPRIIGFPWISLELGFSNDFDLDFDSSLISISIWIRF